MHRQAALTLFAVAYFVGAFGFPAVGGWVLVHLGNTALIALIAACGLRLAAWQRSCWPSCATYADVPARSSLYVFTPRRLPRSF
jgi:hypothetical protein